MGSDENYRLNQREAQRTWQANNPDYWRRYRSTNAPYRARERQRQHRRRHPDQHIQASLQPDVAKMDASTPIKSGTYKMQIVSGVAKMDTLLVQLIVIPEDRRPQERICGCQADFVGKLSPDVAIGSREVNQHKDKP